MDNFNLIKEEFIKEEKIWTYKLNFPFIFNLKEIKFITITDHYLKKEGREGINNNLILNFLSNKLDSEELEPYQICKGREIYFWEWVPYKGKDYRLIFWFKDNTNNHLWIRNFHEVS
jgi:hypothetical protein